MPILIWFFRIALIPFGLACVFVSLDTLYVWGLSGRRPRRGGVVRHTPTSRLPAPLPPHPTPPIARPYAPGRSLAHEPGVRPRPDAWFWWEWKIRRPAFYLLLLGLALIFTGVLFCLPGYGNIPLVSERLEGIAVLLVGLTLLRGTLKIEWPIWGKITLIKRPWGGRARPSLPWMAVGLALCLVGLYGLVCRYADPGTCLGGNRMLGWTLAFALLELISAAVGVMAVEDIAQALQERSHLSPWALWLLGFGLIGMVLVLIGRTLVL